MIVGLPNAGKTTLFNSLTGSNEKVGNWHGVTVKEKWVTTNLKGRKVTFFDLPGLYTLMGSSAEERCAEQILNAKNYDLIILTVDAKRLKRSLKLLEELKSLGKPIIVFINLYADFLEKGGKINEQKAEAFLGATAVFGDAIDKVSVDKLINKILQGVHVAKKGSNIEGFYTPQKNKVKLRRFLFGKFTAFPVFFAITVFTLWLCFGQKSPITAISNIIEWSISTKIAPTLRGVFSLILSPFLVGLLIDGILVGITSVLVFLPQVCSLGFCIDFLDQSGYLSGFSAVADDILGKFGLSGRAVYTLFGGFGCTAIAVNSANGIENRGVRLRTVLSLPFISCSAKTPVYLFFASSIFKEKAFFVICAVWILSILLSLLNSLLLKNTIVKQKTENFVAEIAELKFPSIKNLLKSLQKTAIQFIIKLASIVLIVSAFLWILQNLSTSFTFLNGSNVENSLLAFLGKPFRWLFYPIGITDWRYSVAVLSGVFAKEGVASTLAMLFPSGIGLSVIQGVSLTVFCYAYTPCLTALASYAKNIGVRFAVFCAVYQLIGALLLSYFAYFSLGLLL